MKEFLHFKFFLFVFVFLVICFQVCLWFLPSPTKNITFESKEGFQILSTRTLDGWKRCVYPFTSVPEPQDSIYQNKRPVVVLLWNSLENFLYIHQPSLINCPVPCFIAQSVNEQDPSCWEEIDNIVFHPPTQLKKPFPKLKLEHQFWTLFFTEAESNYPILKEPPYNRTKFDISMNFHLDADIPFTYFIDKNFYFNYWNATNKTNSVILLMSNCEAKNSRNKFIQELFKWIDIDSYGTCFHNKDFPSLPGQTWEEKKFSILSKYKFVIAFENVNTRDYVTEKLFHAFITKTVPIYMGAPNVHQFVPSNRSIIDVQEFRDAKDLGNYVQYLLNNEAAYLEYLSWKDLGENENFRKLQHFSPKTGPCRLCMETVKRRNKLFGT